MNDNIPRKEFPQLQWDSALAGDWQALLELALREDLGDEGDWTTRALVPSGAQARADIVARGAGVVAGLPAAAMTVHVLDSHVVWSARADDGQAVQRGTVVAHLAGAAASLLAAERLVLNLLGRLSGIASLTRAYVEAVTGTPARIYDTRKTTPGWRRLEKYAVRCGGGHNHRTALCEAVLIKDNHLAFGRQDGPGRFTPAEAVARARAYLRQQGQSQRIVEIEVDTLTQLDEVLPAAPDLVLLDNMTPDQLRQAVARRDALGLPIELEASGGVNLATVRAIAESGVDRISVGALTHSAIGLDLALDWA